MRRLAAAALPVLCALAIVPAPAAAETALGDAGHFLKFGTITYLNNPDGRAFELTVHRYNWVIEGGWNDPNLHVVLTGPDGEDVIDEKVVVRGDAGHTFEVDEPAKGVYKLRVNPEGRWQLWYVTSTLDQSVAYAGTGEGHAVRDNWFMANPFVPRRWWFYVPADTKEFHMLAQHVQSYMSEREDYGLTLINPRGQRTRILWGRPAPDEPPVESVRILTEPGSTGRFWAVEVRLGDSHSYADVNLSLTGVPPYLARSPEEWFDPKTGKRAPVKVYDTDQFMQGARNAEATNTSWANWSPAPALGDPDACEILCPATFALWNPEGRKVAMRVGTYLTRGRMGKDLKTAAVRVTGSDGKAVLGESVRLEHIHDPKAGWPDLDLPAKKGVCTVDVTGAEHFLAFTYPATPLVLVAKAEGNWRRFRLEAGTARNWYFRVPEGAKEFTVRADAEHDTDVLDLQVCSPDRVVRAMYDNARELTVPVPPGMDGKIWHVRMDVGSASRIVTADANPRYPSINVTLDLKGVPGYLSPTWEQWFDPENPRRPYER